MQHTLAVIACLLYFMLLSFEGYNQSFFRDHYNDETLKSEGQKHDGAKTGSWRYYFPSGTLMAIEHFNDSGELHGKVITYYPDGKVQSTEQWTAGKLSDSAFYFHENGEVDHKGIYKHSQFAGEWIHYYPDASIEKIIRYREGLPHGPFIAFDEEGNILQEGVFYNGQEIGEWKFYEKGKLRYSGDYKDGKRVGEWFEYDRRGRKKSIQR